MTINEAATTILRAGCSGVPALTWEIERAINGTVPKWSAGDAMFEAPMLYAAVKAALSEFSKGGNA